MRTASRPCLVAAVALAAAAATTFVVACGGGSSSHGTDDDTGAPSSSAGSSGAPSGTTGTTGAGDAGSATMAITSSDAGAADSATGDAAAPFTGTSITRWATCDGVTDDTAAATTAFAAARNGAFPLLIDCPLRLHIGVDIAKPIFIESGTTVGMAGAGKISVDNTLQPAFVLAESSNVTLVDWDLEWDSSLPVDEVVPYEVNGVTMPANGDSPVGGNFNDVTLTTWLTTNRKITFDGVKSRWTGPTNMSSVFLVLGGTSQLTVTGMNAHAAADAGGDAFIPMLFSFTVNWKSGTTVTASTTLTAATADIPHDLVFTDITLDGAYMGFQGNLHDLTVENVVSNRYADLQDADGGTVGGVGKWFAPPHLFYLPYDPNGDPAFFNKNLSITNVTDNGVRIGVARDKGGSDTTSGNALSLKIGGVNSTVDGYTSKRKDGLLDILEADGLTLENITATYDSSFLNGLYPGIRWPTQPYVGVVLKNVSLTDEAAAPAHQPISDPNLASNQDITLDGVSVQLASWPGAISTLPIHVGGTGQNVAVTYSIADVDSSLLWVQQGAVSASLQATPAKVAVGGASTIAWTSTGASGCTSSGGWSGAIGLSGSKMVTFPSAGSSSLVLACAAATASLPIAVGP